MKALPVIKKMIQKTETAKQQFPPASDQHKRLTSMQEILTDVFDEIVLKTRIHNDNN